LPENEKAETRQNSHFGTEDENENENEKNFVLSSIKAIVCLQTVCI